MVRFLSVKIFVICLLLLVCCSLDKKDVFSSYPIEVVENHYEDIYDTAKWVIYCSNFKYSDFICQNKQFDELKNFISSSKELQLHYLQTDSSCITIFLSYKLDSLCKCFPYIDLEKFGYSVVTFDKKTKIILDRHHGYTKFVPPKIYNPYTFFKTVEADSLHISTLKKANMLPYFEQEKEFIKYLQTTNDTINIWLRKEAIKKGILKE